MMMMRALGNHPCRYAQAAGSPCSHYLAVSQCVRALRALRMSKAERADAGAFRKNLMYDCSRVHGNRYDYSKVNYASGNDYLTIVCPQHGEFTLTINEHLKKRQGCPRCEDKLRYSVYRRRPPSTTHQGGSSDRPSGGGESDVFGGLALAASSLARRNASRRQVARAEGAFKQAGKAFVEDAERIHRGRYGYDSVEYLGPDKPVTIRCPTHGNFSLTPTQHITQRRGCPECAASRPSLVVRAVRESAQLQQADEGTGLNQKALASAAS